jgi:VIT1/CCC1 family predicted Fe2+/Mn2+ transporter
MPLPLQQFTDPEPADASLGWLPQWHAFVVPSISDCETTVTKTSMSRLTIATRALSKLGPLLRPRTVRGGRHRDVQGSAARAAVLGSGDGLITNISLVLGVAGASTNVSSVRLAGVAGLLAGAFSMAAGELVSVRAHDELVRHEIDIEQQELADDPVGEQRELAAMYRARGVPAVDADTVARILMATPEVALDTHARLELGVDPEDTGSSVQAAVVSFFSFSIGALLPLLPWFFTGGTTAVLASIAIGAVASVALGATIGSFSAQGVWRTAGRQLLAAIIAASVTYGVGHLLGVGVRAS